MIILNNSCCRSGRHPAKDGDHSGTCCTAPANVHPAQRTAAATTTSSVGDGSAHCRSDTDTTVPIPQTGVYVYVNYIGGWKGSSGTWINQLTETNPGERFLPWTCNWCRNPTGTVTASFSKQDGSSHAITVSTYKDQQKYFHGSQDSPEWQGDTLRQRDRPGSRKQQVAVSGGGSSDPVATTAPVAEYETAKTTTANTTTVAKYCTLHPDAEQFTKRFLFLCRESRGKSAGLSFSEIFCRR